MKRKTLFLMIVIMLCSVCVYAQERGIARGAVSGEIYMSGYWYGIYNPGWGYPIFDTLLKAVYHITDYGKKLTLPYCVDAFAHEEEDYPYFDSTAVVPAYIIADATLGVVYNKSVRHSYTSNIWLYSMQVSFDYGKTWTLREEDKLIKYYLAGNFEEMIYKGQSYGDEKGFFRSFDYGLTYEELPLPNCGGELGLDSCEFWGYGSAYSWPKFITHTMDCGQTCDYMPIDSQYLSDNMSGIFPDVYRGALPGEVYTSSWFSDWTYKISFSADTGRTFRVVYHSDSLYFLNENRTFFLFMSDREAGVFYIIYNELVEMDDSKGHYAKTCISYYTDYGEILVGTYCHELQENYPSVNCQGILSLQATVDDKNNVILSWEAPETGTVTAYHLYRKDELIKKLQETFYADEDLPDGDYTYYIKALYADGCETLSYNTVTLMIDCTGIKEKEKVHNIVVYPNPTNGELIIDNGKWKMENVEIFDLMGRMVMSVTSPPSGGLGGAIDIFHLPTGMYFVRILTNEGAVTKKIIKQ